MYSLNVNVCPTSKEEEIAKKAVSKESSDEGDDLCYPAIIATGGDRTVGCTGLAWPEAGHLGHETGSSSDSLVLHSSSPESPGNVLQEPLDSRDDTWIWVGPKLTIDDPTGETCEAKIYEELIESPGGSPVEEVVTKVVRDVHERWVSKTYETAEETQPTDLTIFRGSCRPIGSKLSVLISTSPKKSDLPSGGTSSSIPRSSCPVLNSSTSIAVGTPVKFASSQYETSATDLISPSPAWIYDIPKIEEDQLQQDHSFGIAAASSAGVQKLLRPKFLDLQASGYQNERTKRAGINHKAYRPVVAEDAYRTENPTTQKHTSSAPVYVDDETYFPCIFKAYAVHTAMHKGIKSAARSFKVRLSKLTEWVNNEKIQKQLRIPNLIFDIDRGHYPTIDIWISTHILEQEWFGHRPSHQEIRHKVLTYARRYPEFNNFLGEQTWVQQMLSRNGLSLVEGTAKHVNVNSLGMVFYAVMPTIDNPSAAPKPPFRRPLFSVLFSMLANGYIFKPYVIISDKILALTLQTYYRHLGIASIVHFSSEATWDQVIFDWAQQIWETRPDKDFAHLLLLDDCFTGALSRETNAYLARSRTTAITGPVDVLQQFRYSESCVKELVMKILEYMYQKFLKMAKATGNSSFEQLFALVQWTVNNIPRELVADSFSKCQLQEYFYSDIFNQ